MIRRQFLVDNIPSFIKKFNNEIIITNMLDQFEYIEQTDKSNMFYKLEINKIIGQNISEYKLKKLIKKCNIVVKTRYYIPLTSNLNAIIDFEDKKPTDIFVDFENEKEANDFIIPDWFGAEIIPNLTIKTKRKSK